MQQIGVEQEYHGDREESCQYRKEECNENIRADSEKSSVKQSGEISVVQKNAEQVEDTIGKGRQTMADKYTERWKIM